MVIESKLSNKILSYRKSNVNGTYTTLSRTIV